MPLQPHLPLRNSLRPAAGTHFFFALVPDASACEEIARVGERFRKSHRLAGTAVAPAELHLTLCDMGSLDGLRQPLEAALLAAAAAVNLPCMTIALDTALRLSAARDGQFPFVLMADTPSTERALALRRALAEAQRSQGLPVNGVSSYLPHVTVLRGHAIDAIGESIMPISWEARAFVLMRSFFGQSRREVIGSWPLQTPPQPELFDLASLPDLPGDDDFESY